METKAVKFYPVLVADINLSKSTKTITGMDSFNELKNGHSTLFSEKSNEELEALILDTLHKGKLKGINKNKIVTMTKEEKRAYAVSILSINVALTQEREATRDDNNRSKAMGLFMKSRVNIGGNVSTKYAFQTAALGEVLEYQLIIGGNFSDFMEKNGNFVYIQRVRTFDPEIDPKTKNVLTEPMRSGSGGDVLRKLDGGVPRLVFMRSELLIEQQVKKDEALAMYDTLYSEETQNEIAFAFTEEDKTFSIDQTTVPAQGRTTDGQFDEDFQNWLNAAYNEGAGIQTEITNALAEGK